jgi:hypothetical protein
MGLIHRSRLAKLNGEPVNKRSRSGATSTVSIHQTNSWSFCKPSDNAELKNKEGRFLNVLKNRNRPVCSALSSATENNLFAELGIMATSTTNRHLVIRAVRVELLDVPSRQVYNA